MKKVNFILPSVPSKPGGGTKIMYEYANRLALKGYEVTVLHSIKRPYKKNKTPVWLRLLITHLKKKPTWFSFSPSVKRKVVKEISDRYVPDADATISTWWQMTYALSSLSSLKGKKINLIQDYEIWTGQEELVLKSYTLPVQHVVIAHYLQEIVRLTSDVNPIRIPNAIDLDKFFITCAVELRDPFSVIMLYSEEKRKGSVFGLEALSQVRRALPNLTVTLFSVFERPENLPDWVNFIRQPKDLKELFNEHAIFFSPSIGEGWALPPAEAMACGCAVVCTDIGGHRDYAFDEQTALLVVPKDSAAMAKGLTRLMLENELRLKLAAQGNEYITNHFSWRSSVSALEQIL